MWVISSIVVRDILDEGENFAGVGFGPTRGSGLLCQQIESPRSEGGKQLVAVGTKLEGLAVPIVNWR